MRFRPPPSTCRKLGKRQLVAMLYLGGTSVAAIALELGCGTANVRSLILNGLRDAAHFHGLEVPKGLRGLEEHWFKAVASLPFLRQD